MHAFDTNVLRGNRIINRLLIFNLRVLPRQSFADNANEALGSAEYQAIKPHRIGNIDMDYGSFVVVEGV